MENIRRYLQSAAEKVMRGYEKPLTPVATMAFLLACMAILPISGFSIPTNLLIEAGIAIVTLLSLLVLVWTHQMNIRALKSRLDDLAAQLGVVSRKQAEAQLSESEVRRFRTLIAEQDEPTNEDTARHDRDRRPSLF